MNAIGIGPHSADSHPVNRRSIRPPDVSRSVSEIPLRMLRVASVAMIDGILKPRISPPFTSPRPTPASRITADPIRIWTFVESVPIRNEAITTPNVTIAPTERSSAPTSSACVWPMATIASGTARNRTLVTFRSLMNPGNFDSAYHITSPIRISCRTTGIHSRKRTTLRHLFLSRASRRTLRTAILAESVRAVLTRRSATGSWAWRSRAASVPPSTGPGRGRSLRRCAAHRVRRRGSPR